MADDESERSRLARLYSEKSDDALSELAKDAGNLTETAQQVLLLELSKRGMQIRAEGVEVGEESQLAPQPKISGPLEMVKRFRDLPEAFVAKSILDSAGIDCFLADENVVRIDWLYSNLIGGAKLMVRPEDLDEATQLLIESENSAALEGGGEENSSQNKGAG